MRPRRGNILGSISLIHKGSVGPGILGEWKHDGSWCHPFGTDGAAALTATRRPRPPRAPPAARELPQVHDPARGGGRRRRQSLRPGRRRHGHDLRRVAGGARGAGAPGRRGAGRGGAAAARHGGARGDVLRLRLRRPHHARVPALARRLVRRDQRPGRLRQRDVDARGPLPPRVPGDHRRRAALRLLGRRGPGPAPEREPRGAHRRRPRGREARGARRLDPPGPAPEHRERLQVDRGARGPPRRRVRRALARGQGLGLRARVGRRRRAGQGVAPPVVHDGLLRHDLRQAVRRRLRAAAEPAQLERLRPRDRRETADARAGPQLPLRALAPRRRRCRRAPRRGEAAAARRLDPHGARGGLRALGHQGRAGLRGALRRRAVDHALVGRRVSPAFSSLETYVFIALRRPLQRAGPGLPRFVRRAAHVRPPGREDSARAARGEAPRRATDGGLPPGPVRQRVQLPPGGVGLLRGPSSRRRRRVSLRAGRVARLRRGRARCGEGRRQFLGELPRREVPLPGVAAHPALLRVLGCGFPASSFAVL